MAKDSTPATTLGRHRAERQRKAGQPKKYRNAVSFGAKLDLSEVQLLGRVSNRIARPRTDILRALVLVLLDRQGLYSPPEHEDEVHIDEALLGVGRRLLKLNGKEEEE